MKKYRIIAEDFGSPLMRNLIWIEGISNYHLLGLPSPEMAIISEYDHIKYITNSSWKHIHDVFTESVKKNISKIRKIIDQTNKLGERKIRFTEQIFNSDVKSMSDDEIIIKLKKFARLQARIYTYGVLLPILDFGELSFVETSVKKYLEKKVGNKAEEYFLTLSSPSMDSFAMQHEKDLLRLIFKYDSVSFRNYIKENDLVSVKEEFPDFYLDLEDHTRKYAWIYYAFSGPASTESDFFETIKSYVDKNVDPKNRLKEMNEEKQRVIRQKKAIIKKLDPDKYNRELLELVGLIVWAKPRRKDYQSISYYHIIESLIKEIALRLNLSIKQALSIPFDILETSLKNKTIDIDLINSIRAKHAVVPSIIGTRVISGDALRNLEDQIEEQVIDNSGPLKGSTACKGDATGMVRIINTPDDLHKMNQGDILVSIATTPSIVSAMKKAAAIITDEGGLTSHASIVSRELRIPCIIGTNYASKVLKDGDFVRVNATNGIITKVGDKDE